MRVAPQPRVWIVLPAYDEAPALESLLPAIDGALRAAGIEYRAVVVDDGSSDGTRQVAVAAAAELPVEVVVHDRNLGLGATLRDGLLTALEGAGPDDVVVTMDADDTHSPALIAPMVERIRAGADVVVASRFRSGSRVHGVPRLRRVMSRLASWLFRVVLPIPGVRDFTSGFRAYRAGALQEVVGEHGAAFFDQPGFQCMVDVLLRLRGRGLSFGEVPMVLRYDRKEGASKMRVWSTAGATLRLMIRRRVAGS